MKTACWCSSRGCGGKLVDRTTLLRHNKADISKIPTTSLTSSSAYFEASLDQSQYETHWAAHYVLPGSQKTLLQKVFEIVQEHAFIPNHTKSHLEMKLKTLSEDYPDLQNLVPQCFDSLQLFLKPFLVPIIVFDMCHNDCIAFRKEYAEEKSCPKCGSSRYDNEGNARKFSYMSVEQRIRRMVETEGIREVLDMHKFRDSDVQHDYQDSKAWKVEYFGPEGVLSDADEGISLTLCLDGVNPYGPHNDYSMWPILLSIDNFPAAVRKTSAGTILAGVVPAGSKGQEPKSLEPYLEILVDEMKAMENTTMKDHRGKDISVKVKILRYVLDFPAIGKVLHLPGSAMSVRACPFCQIRGRWCCKNRMLFVNNRRLLPEDHPLRLETDCHIDGKSEEREPPSPPPTNEEISRLRQQYDQLKSTSAKEKYTKLHGVKGEYVLMQLPDHGFQHQIGPDIMHTLKNAGTTLCRIMGGQISGDVIDAVEEEFRGVSSKSVFPLKKEDCAVVDENMEKLIYPKNSTGLRNSFLKQLGQIYPTHAWHEYLSEGVMMFALKDSEDSLAIRSIMLWLSVCNQITRCSITNSSIEKLRQDQQLAACYMERHCPLVFYLVSAHLLLHEPDIAERFGPVQGRWMFHMERMNCTISRRVTSRLHPEACLTKTFQLLDWVNDVIMGMRLPDITNRTQSSHVDILFEYFHKDKIPTPNTRQKRKRCGVFQEKELEAMQKALDAEIDAAIEVTDYAYYEYTKSSEEKIRYDKRPRSNSRSKSSRFVFVPSHSRYGEIIRIFDLNYNGNVQTWFAISLFGEHCEDFLTKLPYARLSDDREIVMIEAQSLGQPLIVGIETDTIWFISIEHDSQFLWMNEF